MKRILIAGREAQTSNYTMALRAAGTLPIVSLSYADVYSCCGLVLPGGGDIDPPFFGQKNRGSRQIDRELDCLQFAMLDAFLALGKPVLGICKGMQIINVAFGGSICQHLPHAELHAYDNGDRIHMTLLPENTFLFRLYGPGCVVNSAHHQGVDRIGQCLDAIQYGPDLVVEALCHQTLPVFGVQWHPERMCYANSRPDTADGSLLLHYFLDLCQENYG